MAVSYNTGAGITWDTTTLSEKTGTFSMTTATNTAVFLAIKNAVDPGGTADCTIFSVTYGGQELIPIASTQTRGSNDYDLVQTLLFYWHDSWGAFTDTNYSIICDFGGTGSGGDGYFFALNNVDDSESGPIDGIRTAHDESGSTTSPSCPITPSYNGTMAIMTGFSSDSSGNYSACSFGTGWTSKRNGGTGTFLGVRTTESSVETPNAVITSGQADARFGMLTMGIKSDDPITYGLVSGGVLI